MTVYSGGSVSKPSFTVRFSRLCRVNPQGKHKKMNVCKHACKRVWMNAF